MRSSRGHLGVEQAQRDGDLQRQAPQLVQAGEEVDDPVCVHRHERLYRTAGVCSHVHVAHQQGLVVDQARQRRAQATRQRALPEAVLRVQDRLRQQ